MLQIPLVNADRLTASILPPIDSKTRKLPSWAQALRDDDVRWQSLSQEAVRAFMSLIVEKRMPFALETVFSHWRKKGPKLYESKIDDILKLQSAGYFVVLLFVGLSSNGLSVLRVATRRAQGGHDVPLPKLLSRFPRTQRAIGLAAPVADMTLMFDNSRTPGKAFALVRAQKRKKLLFDCRDRNYHVDRELRGIASLWLDKVAPQSAQV